MGVQFNRSSLRFRIQDQTLKINAVLNLFLLIDKFIFQQLSFEFIDKSFFFFFSLTFRNKVLQLCINSFIPISFMFLSQWLLHQPFKIIIKNLTRATDRSGKSEYSSQIFVLKTNKKKKKLIKMNQYIIEVKLHRKAEIGFVNN